MPQIIGRCSRCGGPVEYVDVLVCRRCGATRQPDATISMDHVHQPLTVPEWQKSMEDFRKRRDAEARLRELQHGGK